MYQKIKKVKHFVKKYVILTLQTQNKPKENYMKKLSLLALAAVTLVACGDSKPTPEDYTTIETEIQNSVANGVALSITAIGQQGDYIITLPATETLTAIGNKARTVAFLSVENPAQYVAEGQCLLNIIPDKVMADMGTPENKCNFRLFCGTAEQATGEAYAVEVCAQ